jgi:hypothetical protein
MFTVRLLEKIPLSWDFLFCSLSIINFALVVVKNNPKKIQKSQKNFNLTLLSIVLVLNNINRSVVKMNIIDVDSKIVEIRRLQEMKIYGK